MKKQMTGIFSANCAVNNINNITTQTKQNKFSNITQRFKYTRIAFISRQLDVRYSGQLFIRFDFFRWTERKCESRYTGGREGKNCLQGRKSNPKNYFFYFFSSDLKFFCLLYKYLLLFTHTPYFTNLFLTNDNFLIQRLKVVKYTTMGCLFKALLLSLYIERMNSINFKRNYL